MQGKTVLTCLDGSRTAEAALAYARAVAAAERAAVRLVAVMDSAFGNPLFWRAEADARRIEDHQHSAQRYLHGQVSALRTQGLEASAFVAVGDPVEQILHAADVADVSMIVMATHGRGGLQRWALGSVADKVMRMSHRPTLLIRPQETPKPEAAASLRRLAVPLDGSPLAEQALAPAMELAEAAGAEVLLVRVEQWWVTDAARWGGEVGYVPNMGDLDQAIADAARTYLAGVRQQLPSSLRAEVSVLRGFAALELEAFFEQRQVDLVVMTTHARSGLPRLMLGSTADRLVRDGVPALLIHPAEEQSTG